MCVTLYGQLVENRQVYENQRIRKNKKEKMNKKSNNQIPQKSVNQLVTKDYDSDSSSDSTWTTWWRDVYGFDMRSRAEFLVIRDSENKNCSQFNKWRIMPEPIFAFFDPYKVKWYTT